MQETSKICPALYWKTHFKVTALGYNVQVVYMYLQSALAFIYNIIYTDFTLFIK